MKATGQLLKRKTNFLMLKSTYTNVQHATKDKTFGGVSSGYSSLHFFKISGCTSTSSFWNLFSSEIIASSCDVSLLLWVETPGFVVSAHGTFWTLRFLSWLWHHWTFLQTSVFHHCEWEKFLQIMTWWQNIMKSSCFYKSREYHVEF